VIQLSVINKDVYLSPTHTYPVLITVSIYRLIPLPEDFLSDVQTDVHLVPVDTVSDTHKLLILLMSQ